MTTKVSFENLPSEILLNILDYLSTNEIIYAFLCLKSQFRRFLFEHERYLNNYEISIVNYGFYEKILPIFTLRVRSLTIPTTDLSFSLDILPNLRTVIISSPFGLSDQSLQRLLSSKQFQSLRVFKIQSEKYLKSRSSILRDNFEHYLFANIFQNQNKLQIFECASLIILFSRKTVSNFHRNPSLTSLTLYLNEFRDIFIVLRYTPNLIHLNIKTTLCVIHQKHEQWFNNDQTKLQRLYLTFVTKDSIHAEYMTNKLDFLHLVSDIKLFSSTLTCLSMNFIDLQIYSTDEFPFNGLKLQHQLLVSMTELKQFHLYSKIQQQFLEPESVLATFQDQFWFDRNWSIGMHGKYLYTLPFHFDELHDFLDFDRVKSNNNKILNSCGIWSKVKLIQLARSNRFNLGLIKQMKIKFPRLNAIRFLSSGLYSYSEVLEQTHINEDEILRSVSIVDLEGGSMENIKQWLVYVLPNVKHLSLSYTGLPSTNSQLVPILNSRIERLDIIEQSIIEQINRTNRTYFSNVKDLRLMIYNVDGKFHWYVNTLMKILRNYKRLNMLLICIVDDDNVQTFRSSEAELSKIIEYLKMNGIERYFHIKRHRESAVFYK
ncbi:unnamed protein product [Adineta ricciae]|uniref:F-box domain-containing protein n=1 Tax=Adineta ricciae TaxID=249248 RepID=A0A814P8M7_ADIRI|nr:unnamed protein product [Adineta ricciae]CAF1370157.1 unnamed protein product [Adineta ricciae]